MKGEGERIIRESDSGIVENNNDYLSLSKKIEDLLKLKKMKLKDLGSMEENITKKHSIAKRERISYKK